jgi:hypothetical protein
MMEAEEVVKLSRQEEFSDRGSCCVSLFTQVQPLYFLLVHLLVPVYLSTLL